MELENWKKSFAGKVPESALDYCYRVWQQDPFQLTLTGNRITKLGDYSFVKGRLYQRISINQNLSVYQFLITYLHEVAHHRVFSQFGMGKKPHGIEWKRAFQELMMPMLTERVFPMDVLIPLRRHMVNPKASTSSDFFLIKELKKYDPSEIGNEETLVFLRDIRVGSAFEIKSRVFKKLETRRTKVLCQELSNGKRFLISSHAEVLLVEPHV